jgi:hypothetical protein
MTRVGTIPVDLVIPDLIGLRPIHVFRTTLETELKMRVGVYDPVVHGLSWSYPCRFRYIEFK